jgi:vesicle coat complex subunit
MLVRVGACRLALRGTIVLTSACAAVLLGRPSTPTAAQAGLPTGAQDAAQLQTFMSRVRGIDPTVCALIGRSLNNRWGGWHSLLAVDGQGGGADARLLSWLDGAEIDARLLPTLRTALNDSDACTRRTAAQLLGRARVSDLSVELRTELRSANAGTREAALLALGHFDKPSGFDDARSALRDSEPGVRATAAWALGMIERADAVGVLAESARDSNVGVRRVVAWALGAIESSSALPTLIDMLDDADSSVRIQAALALGAIENADAITPLTRLLQSDRDPQVRRAAAAAIGQISS